MKSLAAGGAGVGGGVRLTGAAKAERREEADRQVEVTKSGGETPMGTIVDFQKDGKMTAVANLDGNEVKLTGTYKFDGKKLKVDLKLNEEKIEHEFEVKFKSDDEVEFVNGAQDGRAEEEVIASI